MLAAIGLFATAHAHAASLTTLYSFAGSTDGQSPQTRMVYANGVFYGTTYQGGRYHNGTVFRLDPSTGAVITLYAFAGAADGKNPSGGLIQVGNLLYGTTTSGTYRSGTIFSLDPASGVLTTLYAFTGGADGGFPEASLLSTHGLLYGTARRFGSNGCGTLFAFDPSASTFKTVHEFTCMADGGYPAAALIAGPGGLYGTAAGFGNGGGGVVFKFDPAGGAVTPLYSFTSQKDGGTPLAPLLLQGGMLYGTTESGGSSIAGVVFKIDPKTLAETTLYSFTGNADGGSPYAGLTAAGGLLYGTTSFSTFSHGGAVFSIDPSTGAETTLHSFPGDLVPNNPDGYAPLGELVTWNGKLFGTASGGGSADGGTAFSVDPMTGAETTVHSFVGTPPGTYFTAGLLGVGGTLYGTNPTDGTAGLGSVFKFDPSTGTETILHSFLGGTDGYRPLAALIAAGKSYYGTTFGADISSGSGTVFQIDPAKGALRTLHDFSQSDGHNPQASLLVRGGLLYGTTDSTAFSLNRVNGSIDTLARFFDHTSMLPSTNFVLFNGLLYATTEFGGTAGAGTIYSIDPKTGAEKTLYNFTGGLDGAIPLGALLPVGGLLYGTASGGGSQHDGTVFKFDPATGALTVLHEFFGGDGQTPSSALIRIQNYLYGTTAAGGTDFSDVGTVFRIDPSTGDVTTLYSFTGGADGGAPHAGLTPIGAKLYSTTSVGGANGSGTIFSIDPSNP